MRKSKGKTGLRGLLTTQEVSKKTGKSRTWVLHNIRNGRLKASQIGGQYLIQRKAVEDWIANARPPGRPRKKKA